MTAADRGAIIVERDLVYLDEDRAERLDLYRPSSGPVRGGLIFLHGGAFHRGDKGEPRERGLCGMLAENGYLAASVNYKLSQGVSGPARWTAWPRNLQDARAALDFLAAEGPRLGLDPARRAVVGASAGGTLALLLAFSEPTVKAVVNLYGRTDWFRHTTAAKAPPSERVGLAASPLHLLDKVPAPPPVLTIHGLADEVVPPIHGRLLHEALRARGLDAELILLPDAPHAFGLEPDPPRIRGAILAFLDRVFRKNAP